MPQLCGRMPKRPGRGIKRGPDAHALGRSMGGRSKGSLTTKIHGLTDGLGLALRLIATGGQRSEMTQAAALLAGFKADHVLADKGYDGRCVIDAVNESGAMPVIPSRKNARKPRQTDMALYRNVILSSVSLAISNSSGLWLRDMTSISKTIWASSISQLSKSGSNN